MHAAQAQGSRRGLKQTSSCERLLRLDDSDDALSSTDTPTQSEGQSRFLADSEVDRGRNGPVEDGLGATYLEASGKLQWGESRETFTVAQGALGPRALLGRRQIPILEGG
jgi:hypothetical protein